MLDNRSMVTIDPEWEIVEVSSTRPSRPYIPRVVPLDHRLPCCTPASLTDQLRVRLVSYNILAQKMIKRENYPYCPHDDTLKFNYRRKNLLMELGELDFDIGCLQEVDMYDRYYKEAFETIGYHVEYLLKDHYDPAHTSAPPGHGIAILVRPGRFRVIQRLDIDYKECMPDMVVTNVALAVMIECRTTGALFIVATTHLYWRVTHEDVRLRQMDLLLRKIDSFRGSTCCPVILAGDFNSAPSSLLYRTVTHQASDDKASIEEYVMRTEQQAGPTELRTLVQRLRNYPKFESAYKYYKLADSTHSLDMSNLEPDYSSYCQCKEVLDYIFMVKYLDVDKFSAPHFHMERLLKFPPKEFVDYQGALPNHHYSSDHVAIGVELVLHLPQ
jgi:mRNA deadenylase 3'-5' endonuclease subunit Ccr4